MADYLIDKFYKGKKVLVTGGTGLIGLPLVKKLLNHGATVRVASLDDSSRCPAGAEFVRADLTHFNECLSICEGIDFVFHLAGIKGSPKMTSKKPASFFVPLLSMNTNTMEAARRVGVKGYLYTSTIGVYSPAAIFFEDDVWKTFPSENDKFAGWAKRMGELQAESYQIQYNWNDIAIVRPANVYGPYDNFDPENAMVIPSLIKRAMDGENPLTVWGDGLAVRDFIYAEDVAQGMILALMSHERRPINLGSGNGVSVKEITDIIRSYFNDHLDIVWDTSKPSGDKRRVMDISRAKSIGFEPRVDIREGIFEVMNWYKQNKNIVDMRFNVFKGETRK